MENDRLFSSNEGKEEEQKVPTLTAKNLKNSPPSALRYKQVTTINETVEAPEQAFAVAGPQMAQTMSVFSRYKIDDAGSADFISNADPKEVSSAPKSTNNLNDPFAAEDLVDPSLEEVK